MKTVLALVRGHRPGRRGAGAGADAAGPAASNSAAGRAAGAADLRGAGRRHRLQGRAAAGQRPGHGQRRHLRRHRELAGHQLRRAAALGAGHEPDPDLGPRLQHQHARRHLHAGHLAAGAHRRPQPLPRLLRLRRLGLPAGQPQRGAADRGDPRTGVGHLGRQRAVGRGQLHHQDPARAGRQQLHGRRRHLRARGQRQRPRQRRDVVHQRDDGGGGQRPLVLQVVGRLVRPRRDGPPGRDHRQRAATRPYPSFANTGTRQPKFDTPGRLRRARGRLQAVVRRRLRRHRGHDPHRHRAVRHGRRHRARLRLGALDQGGAEGPVLHQHPQRRRQRAAVGRASTASRSSSSSTPRPSTSSTATSTRSAPATSSATAATSVTTSSTCRWRRAATTAPRAASTSRTRSSSTTTCAGWSARGSTSSACSTIRTSRRGPPSSSSRRPITPSASRSTAPSAPRR